MVTSHIYNWICRIRGAYFELRYRVSKACIDLQNKWESRKDTAPKTIDQIHKDAQMEDFAMKQKAQELKQSSRQMQGNYNDRKYQSSYSGGGNRMSNSGHQSQQEWQVQTASTRPVTDVRANISKITSVKSSGGLVSIF